MAGYVVCTSIAAGLGLALNSYALCVLLWGHDRLHAPNNLLLLHLTCVDIAFCLLVLSGNASAPSSSESENRIQQTIATDDTSATCRAQGYAWASLPVLILWSVCALSCDRYAAIVSPLHYSRLVSRSKASAFLFASWLVGASLTVPPLVLNKDPTQPLGPCPYRYCRATLSCRPDCTAGLSGDLIFAILYVGLGALLPLCVVLACSWRVLKIARSHRSRIVSALYRVALSASSVAAPTPRRGSQLAGYKGKNAIWTTGQLVGSLVALSAPFFVGVLWEAATGSASNEVYLSVSTALLTCAPPANAYVYGIRSRVLRRTFRHLVQRYMCKRQALRALGSSSRRASLASRRYSAPVGSLILTPDESDIFTRSTMFTRSLRTQKEMEGDDLLTRRASLLSPKSGLLQVPLPSPVHVHRPSFCRFSLPENGETLRLEEPGKGEPSLQDTLSATRTSPEEEGTTTQTGNT